MNATECKKLSIKNKIIVDKENTQFERNQRAKELKERQDKHLKFYNKLKKEIKDDIKYAVKRGENSSETKLKINFSLNDGSEYSYNHYEYKPEIEKIMKEYRKQGFTCSIENTSEYHDTSDAYMNSGGECGSSTPYYTKHTVIEISWK